MNIQEMLKFESLLDHLKSGRPATNKVIGRIQVFGSGAKAKMEGPAWKVKDAKNKTTLWADGAEGPVVSISAPKSVGSGPLDVSLYAHFRDSVGECVPRLEEFNCEALIIEFTGTTDEEELASLVGLGLGSYKFQTFQKIQNKLPSLFVQKADGSNLDSIVKEAKAIAQGTNLARHLVNLPGQTLNPKTYAQLVQKYFSQKKDVQVEVWNEQRLRKENMGLILSVGQGASEKPCLVRVKYRPSKKSSKAPYVFVGKGITFDSGGLDIKPAQFMRFMKKDMGGSASVLGLASWVVEQKFSAPCDFYIAIAENAVDAGAARPGDVFTAKNGISVEIHNTDAEGRMALADALVVATEQKDKPRLVIDMATLTGAMKVGLGSEVAGFFSTDPELARRVRQSSDKRGDLTWEMPLYAGYDSMLASSFADTVNSVDGYGGAITAALFLKKFVGDTPWMHFDIYAWTDRPQKALQAAGGNGQLVQLMSDFLTQLESEDSAKKSKSSSRTKRK